MNIPKRQTLPNVIAALWPPPFPRGFGTRNDIEQQPFLSLIGHMINNFSIITLISNLYILIFSTLIIPKKTAKVTITAFVK